MQTQRGSGAGPGWLAAALSIAAVALTPIIVLLGSFLTPQGDIWRHLAENVLGGLVANTLTLLALVLPLSAVLGVGAGWLTGACDFPGRRFFSWALVLPFAIPPYVFAFVYLGLFDFSGPVQSLLRESVDGFTFVDIRNVGGVASILSLAFYPYVYLMSRSAFLTQGRTAMEAARSLGQSPTRAFFRVALPMARPWIAAGLVLTAMETLADFGAVSIFNYDTFTTAIYKAWFGLYSLGAASQLASVLVVFVLAAMVLEQRLRRKVRFTGAGRSAAASRLVLKGPAKWAACGACSLLFIAGFAAPCAQLAVWAWEMLDAEARRHLSHALNTLMLGGAAAALATAAGLVLSFARRTHPGPLMRWSSRVATLGYALPGTVLAVGVFVPAAWLDNTVLDGMAAVFGVEIGPVIQGSVGLMLAGYCIRFLSAGYGSIDSAMQRVTPSIAEAARTMGVTGFGLVRRVYAPMMRSGVVTAAILVLVDVMKEMPITLMMRPFGWDTLAVKIYEYTSEGEWELAALPAVALVLVGLLPILVLTRKTET